MDASATVPAWGWLAPGPSLCITRAIISDRRFLLAGRSIAALRHHSLAWKPCDLICQEACPVSRTLIDEGRQYSGALFFEAGRFYDC